jgi:hypothetical protein
MCSWVCVCARAHVCVYVCVCVCMCVRAGVCVFYFPWEPFLFSSLIIICHVGKWIFMKWGHVCVCVCVCVCVWVCVCMNVYVYVCACVRARARVCVFYFFWELFLFSSLIICHVEKLIFMRWGHVKLRGDREDHWSCNFGLWSYIVDFLTVKSKRWGGEDENGMGVKGRGEEWWDGLGRLFTLYWHQWPSWWRGRDPCTTLNHRNNIFC